MRHSIMTEKIARRGVRVPAEYAADFLAQLVVKDDAASQVATVAATQTLAQVRDWVAAHAPGSQHQGFPVLDAQQRLVGVVTRRDLLDPSRPGDRTVGEVVRAPLAVAFEDDTLRDAADHMVREGVGRLPVVSRAEPRKLVGIITRSDLLSAHRRRLEAQRPSGPTPLVPLPQP